MVLLWLGIHSMTARPLVFKKGILAHNHFTVIINLFETIKYSETKKAQKKRLHDKKDRSK